MGSKGRLPPPHLRRPLPGPGIVHPEPFGHGIRPPPGPFPPFDMLPPAEIMEQKLAAQHAEMQRLAMENQRLAATHETLRQELAASQHELQILHAQVGAVKSEREQHMRSLVDKIAKLEAELQAAEPVKLELQQARADAQNLVVARKELISKSQQLTQDLQRVHSDVQQIPALMGELEGLRQEYQHCRGTYDYEKKLYNDHLESLQVMEKNYVTMAREVEKLRAELTNTANVDRRTGGPYGGTPGNNENEASGLPVGQNAYEDGYSVAQGVGPVPLTSGNGTTTTTIAAAVGASAPGYAGVPRGHNYDSSGGSGYDAPTGPTYDPQRGPTYDVQRVATYDTLRGSVYDAQRGAIFDAQRTSYDPQRMPGYDVQRGPAYDASRGYDAQLRGAAGPHGRVAPANNVPYGSATPPARGGSGYEAPLRGGNPVRR
ncbi:Protein FLX-like [Quillaja saponaria]|uniref:Protein FLX-like n=1 Tax=Quillaja saponaria TaxID=32244 RepID=A0AAD7PXU9_QUISA|nr:Protein FLX-like [Quillaja saponaria]